jgi:hypothetical protein
VFSGWLRLRLARYGWLCPIRAQVSRRANTEQGAFPEEDSLFLNKATLATVLTLSTTTTRLHALTDPDSSKPANECGCSGKEQVPNLVHDDPPVTRRESPNNRRHSPRDAWSEGPGAGVPPGPLPDRTFRSGGSDQGEVTGGTPGCCIFSMNAQRHL